MKKTNNEFFNLNFFKKNEVIEKIKKEGGISIKNFLKEKFIQEILEEVKRIKFEKQPSVVGKVIQELDLFKLEEPIDDFYLEKFKNIINLRNKFQDFINFEFKEINLNINFNSIYIQRYLPGTFGISPHKDSKYFVKLIAIFSLSGDSRFFICKDKECKEAFELDCSKCSLILLRAPGFLNENFRPLHYLTGPKKEIRYSIALREKWK